MALSSTGEGDPKAHNGSTASVDDAVFEYWVGNPSVEIDHGYICATAGPAARAVLGEPAAAGAPREEARAQGEEAPVHAASSAVSSTMPPPPCAGSSVVLASSVPCYMSAPELCDFLGAFGDETHRLFRHCRVLHGRSPEEYLIALWLTSPAAAVRLIAQHDGRRYNAIEPGVCRLHRVVGCLRRGLTEAELLPRAGSPNALALKRSMSSSSSAPATSPGSGHLRSPVPQRAVPSVRLPAGASPPCGSSPMLRASSPAAMPSLPLDNACAGSPEEDLFRACASLHCAGGASPSDKPFCTVCLEHIEVNPSSYQLTELGGGVPLTILCGHTFHSRCLSRWCDSTCPVCRFQQHPYQTSSCDVCGQSDGIHLCLVCSFVGCTLEDGQGHAEQHFKDTSHAYALEVSTQRVWDYAGNGYVHRLLYNHHDGKMVEHSVPPISPGPAGRPGGLFGGAGEAPSDIALTVGHAAAAEADAAADLVEAAGSTGEGGLSGLARGDLWSGARPGAKKQESVVAEFNALMSSQMTAQRRYFEEKHKEQELQHARELAELEGRIGEAAANLARTEQRLAAAMSANQTAEQELSNIVAAEEVMRRQLQQLEALNAKISGEQQRFEVEAENSRQQQRALRRSRTQEVEDLQQQIRDLELYVQMRKKLEVSTDEADLQGSHVLVTESDQPARMRGGRRQRRR